MYDRAGALGRIFRQIEEELRGLSSPLSSSSSPTRARTLGLVSLFSGQCDLLAFLSTCKHFRDAWRAHDGRQPRMYLEAACRTVSMVTWVIHCGAPWCPGWTRDGCWSERAGVWQPYTDPPRVAYRRKISAISVVGLTAAKVMRFNSTVEKEHARREAYNAEVPNMWNGKWWKESIISVAAEKGDIELLKWCLRHRCKATAADSAVAAATGNLLMMQWMKSTGAFPWDASVLSSAAKHGHFDLLKWLFANGCKHTDGKVMEAAAYCGRLDILLWLVRQGVSMNAKQRGRMAVVAAAEAGKLDAVAWLYARDFEICSWTCEAASRHGHVDVLKFLVERGAPCDSRCCQLAARGGHRPVLTFLNSHGVRWDTSVMEELAARGDIETMAWAIQEGAPLDWRVCAEAAKNGHLKALQWLRNVARCPWSRETATVAAEQGHLEIVQYCRREGCPVGRETCRVAARAGNLEILKYLVDTGAVWSRRDCFHDSRYDHHHVCEWVLQQGEDPFDVYYKCVRHNKTFFDCEACSLECQF